MVGKFNFDVSVLWYHDRLKTLLRVETGSLSKSVDGVQTLKGSFQPEHSWLRCVITHFTEVSPARKAGDGAWIIL